LAFFTAVHTVKHSDNVQQVAKLVERHHLKKDHLRTVLLREKGVSVKIAVKHYIYTPHVVYKMQLNIDNDLFQYLISGKLFSFEFFFSYH
jgi:mannitol/fructose-specific phosphotransferase system IIA component